MGRGVRAACSSDLKRLLPLCVKNEAHCHHYQYHDHKNTPVLAARTRLHICTGTVLKYPKALFDAAVAKKFPKEKLTITLDKPTTKFSKDRQKIELCGIWTSKLPKQSGDFCLDFHPSWNKVKGEIEISQINILKLTSGDAKELPAGISGTLNSTLLTLLDGTSVYHVPDMVGKHMDKLEVQESSFKLVF